MRAIRAWLQGAGDAPIEAVVLKAAAQWGVPPWQVEAECSSRWWGWQLAYWRAEAQVSHQIGSEMKRGKHG